MTCTAQAAAIEHARIDLVLAEGKREDAYGRARAAIEHMDEVCECGAPKDLAACGAAHREVEVALSALEAAIAEREAAAQKLAEAQSDYNSCVSNCPGWVWLWRIAFG